MSNKYFQKPTIYVSHAILGVSGDMEGNCRIAQAGVRKLRQLFPEVDWYLPADSDLVLQILYNAGRLSIRNILWADLEILKACSGWFFYRFEESKGSEIERIGAKAAGLVEDEENDVRYDIGKANFSKIRRTFLPIVEKTIKNFRGSA